VQGDETEKQELEAISDRLMAEAGAVKRLEAIKRSHPISSPEFHELAEEIADHARQVFRLADEEDAVGDRIPRDGDDINDVATREWRKGGAA
jgi:NTP pyrophosphatase (non-canonical NTP hydrolase)